VIQVDTELRVLTPPYDRSAVHASKMSREVLHVHQHLLVSDRQRDYTRALLDHTRAHSPLGVADPAAMAYLWALRGHLRAFHDVTSVRHPMEILEDLHAHLSAREQPPAQVIEMPRRKRRPR